MPALTPWLAIALALVALWGAASVFLYLNPRWGRRENEPTTRRRLEEALGAPLPPLPETPRVAWEEWRHCIEHEGRNGRRTLATSRHDFASAFERFFAGEIAAETLAAVGHFPKARVEQVARSVALAAALDPEALAALEAALPGASARPAWVLEGGTGHEPARTFVSNDREAVVVVAGDCLSQGALYAAGPVVIRERTTKHWLGFVEVASRELVHHWGAPRSNFLAPAGRLAFFELEPAA